MKRILYTIAVASYMNCAMAQQVPPAQFPQEPLSPSALAAGLATEEAYRQMRKAIEMQAQLLFLQNNKQTSSCNEDLQKQLNENELQYKHQTDTLLKQYHDKEEELKTAKDRIQELESGAKP